MNYRRLREMVISEIGYGCYGLSGVYGKSPQDYIETIKNAFEIGINFFDTAEAYGDAEIFLGEVVKPYRIKIYIASKVGARRELKTYLSPDYLMSACEDSLKRLGTDYIDLYQIHFDDPDTQLKRQSQGTYSFYFWLSCCPITVFWTVNCRPQIAEYSLPIG